MLTLGQQLAMDSVLSGRNTFITGPPGTGKTYLLVFMMSILSEMNRNAAICALTGAAASLIDGARTLHSFLGIGIQETFRPISIVKSLEKKNPSRILLLKKLDVFIVDEVSMLSAELNEKISEILKIVRDDPREYGGLQVVFVGDFLQIPPVTGRFCFCGQTFENLNFKKILLTENVRQAEDSEFADFLNRVRVGVLQEKDLDMIGEMCSRQFPPDVSPTLLFAKNAQVENVNNREFRNLCQDSSLFIHSFPVFTRKGKKTAGRDYAKLCGIPEVLLLVKGTQVMITRNINVEQKIVNGSRGIVEDVSGDSRTVQVKLTDGRVVPITYVEVEIMGDPVEGKESSVESTTEKSVATANDGKKQSTLFSANGTKKTSQKQEKMNREKSVVSFIPLKHAWAISQHKAQGATLPFVEIDLGHSVFTDGQAYVALSRVRSSNDVKLTAFKRASIRANPAVLKFYNETDFEVGNYHPAFESSDIASKEEEEMDSHENHGSKMDKSIV